MPRQIVRRALHLFLRQHPRDLIRSVSLDGQPENPAHYPGGILVNQPAIFILRVFAVTVNGVVGGMLALHAPCMENSGDFSAAIPDIPLVHDVQKRRELTAFPVLAVHAVGDGDKANALLSEHDFRVKPDLQIIAPDAAHVLDNDRVDSAIINPGNHLFPPRAVKAAARPSVVGEVGKIGKTVLPCVVLQHLLLVDDAVAVPSKLVVA